MVTERKPDKAFWDWLRTQPNGAEWADRFEPTFAKFATLGINAPRGELPPELGDAFLHFQTVIQPRQVVEPEGFFPTELTPEEEYILNVDTFLKREFDAGRLTFEGYIDGVNSAIRAVDTQGLNPNLPFFQEAIDLPPEEFVKGIERQRKAREEEELKQRAETAEIQAIQAQARVPEAGEVGAERQAQLDEIDRRVAEELPNLSERAQEEVADLLKSVFQGGRFGQDLEPVSPEAQQDVQLLLQELSPRSILDRVAELSIRTDVREQLSPQVLDKAIERAIEASPGVLQGKLFGQLGTDIANILGTELQEVGRGRGEFITQEPVDEFSTFAMTGKPFEPSISPQEAARLGSTLAGGAVLTPGGGGGDGFETITPEQIAGRQRMQVRVRAQARGEFEEFLIRAFPRSNIGLALRQFPLIFEEFGGAKFPGTLGGSFKGFLAQKGAGAFNPFVTPTRRPPRAVTPRPTRGTRIR